MNALARIPSVPVLKRPDVGVYILIGLCLAIGYGTRTFQATRTIVQTKTVKMSPTEAIRGMSAVNLIAALGKPDQVQTQNGVTCAVWQSRAMQVCYR